MTIVSQYVYRTILLQAHDHTNIKNACELPGMSTHNNIMVHLLLVGSQANIFITYQLSLPETN